MPQGRISKRTVDAHSCSAGKDRAFLWDEALAGFGVAVFPNGKKTYVAQFRRHGRSRRVTIGDHGRLTPDEARSEAKKILGGAETGVDLVAQRKADRAVQTFGQLADEFIEHHVSTKRKARTLSEYRGVLERYLRPAIGTTRMADLSPAEIWKLHSKLRKSPYAANRAVALVSAVWNWAARRGEVEKAKNPCLGLERFEERGRERFLSSIELARIGDVLRKAETIGLPYSVDESSENAKHAPKVGNRRRILDPYAIAAIRLLILTGARLREILHAKWAEVDFERGILHLTDSKTGRKPVYLSAAALALLSALPKVSGNPFVVPGDKEGAPRVDLKKPWVAITKAADLEGLRVHDLRHSFASVGAGASLGLPIIGKLLGHSQPATTHRYAHLDADPMRRAVETIGATISAALDGKNSNIVPLRDAG